MSASRSLSGVKRTSAFALHMSAFDPKRTCPTPLLVVNFGLYDRCLSLGAGNEAARFYQDCRFWGRVAVDGSRAAVGDAGDWVFTERVSFWRNASCHRFPYWS